MKAPIGSGAFSLALFLSGCASYRAWTFGPSPQDHEFAVGSPELLVARIQVAALGLADVPDSGDPARVEMRFRLRVANATAEPIELASDACDLVDGDLRAFGTATILAQSGPAELTVAPKEARVFELAFALPADKEPKDLDLSGIVLRFGVLHEGRVREASAHFERLHPGARPHDPWYDPWWGWRVGFGFGYVHCD